VSEHDEKPGAILAGKYRVERVLGKGGMGVVVEATQLDLERRVALKFLRHATLPETSTALQRFEREARAVARLRGPHVVQVFDVGRLEHGEPFIVMELLTGEDLKAVLDREGPLPVTTAVEHLAQTCEAIAEAHVAGVVHRDLKPANLFVARRADGRPLIKVLDFGISKLMSETTSVNLTSGVLGSPLYMSPEQLSSSQSIDYRTDIWSLGAILYELLTGANAFRAEGLPQVCARILLGRPDPMKRPGVEIPSELEAVVLKCLSRLPEERYVTVADLATALLPFGRKSTSSSVEAAVRIIQGSNLRHAGLPQAFDSVPPPGVGAGRARGGTEDTTVASNPSFTVEATVDISGAESGTTQGTATSSDITQGELRPLVAESPSRFGQQSRLRPLTLGAVALVVTGGALFAAQLARSPKEASEATATSASPLASPLGAGTAPAPLAQQPISSVPVVPLPATSALSKPAAAASTVSSAAPPPKGAAPVRKPRPAPRPASDSNDDMLKHR
jgi:eukaryotic-like serine/threonine-protein kinase